MGSRLVEPPGRRTLALPSALPRITKSSPPRPPPRWNKQTVDIGARSSGHRPLSPRFTTISTLFRTGGLPLLSSQWATDTDSPDFSPFFPEFEMHSYYCRCLFFFFLSSDLFPGNRLISSVIDAKICRRKIEYLRTYSISALSLSLSSILLRGRMGRHGGRIYE